MSEATPGPWMLCTDAEWFSHTGLEKRNRISQSSGFVVYADGKLNEPKDALEICVPQFSEANARLIAASPDLLAACQLAREFIRNGIELGYIRMPSVHTPDPAHKTLPAIEAAIAKATGKA